MSFKHAGFALGTITLAVSTLAVTPAAERSNIRAELHVRSTTTTGTGSAGPRPRDQWASSDKLRH